MLLHLHHWPDATPPLHRRPITAKVDAHDDVKAATKTSQLSRGEDSRIDLSNSWGGGSGGDEDVSFATLLFGTFCVLFVVQMSCHWQVHLWYIASMFIYLAARSIHLPCGHYTNLYEDTRCYVFFTANSLKNGSKSQWR